MVGPIDVKQKGGASVGFWVNHMTLTFDLTHDLDLWFWSNFKIIVSEEQGWGQVLFEVLESSTSIFHICKYKYNYKYSKYLEDIKYFYNQVQVKYKYFDNKQKHFPSLSWIMLLIAE